MGHHTIKNGYQTFADRLNLLPQGAPQTKALYPLLEALVSEKEAEVLSLLPVRPFSIEKAAKALKKSPLETEKILTDLASKAMLLDVTDPEPLPAGHRLWQLPTAVVTPHVSGGYHLQETHNRIAGIFAENLRRFVNGEALKNQVDLAAGY